MILDGDHGRPALRVRKLTSECNESKDILLHAFQPFDPKFEHVTS